MPSENTQVNKLIKEVEKFQTYVKTRTPVDQKIFINLLLLLILGTSIYSVTDPTINSLHWERHNKTDFQFCIYTIIILIIVLLISQYMFYRRRNLKDLEKVNNVSLELEETDTTNKKVKKLISEVNNLINYIKTGITFRLVIFFIILLIILGISIAFFGIANDFDVNQPKETDRLRTCLWIILGSSIGLIVGSFWFYFRLQDKNFEKINNIKLEINKTKKVMKIRK